MTKTDLSNTPLTIAIFTDTYKPQVNGVVTSIDTFATSFRKLGHRVVIFAPQEKGAVEEEDVHRFPAVTYPFQSEYSVSLPFLKPVVNFDSFKFDIVHVQTPFSIGLLGLKLAKKFDLPVVHTYHTFFEQYLHYFPVLPTQWLVKPARMLSRQFCNKFDAIFSPSLHMKKRLAAYKIKSPLFVVPTGITIPKVSETDQKEFMKHYNLKRNDKIAVYIGRLGKEKNVEFLLAAFLELSTRLPDLKLVIGGGGPEKAMMEEWVESNQLSNRVIFTGYLSRQQVWTAFSCSHLYLFPSTTETQGLTLLESFSVGTPAVCIRSMGVRFVMQDELGGTMVKQSVSDYVAAANELLTLEPLRHQKSEEALNRAQDFEADSIAKSTIGIFRELIEAKKLKSKKSIPLHANH